MPNPNRDEDFKIEQVHWTKRSMGTIGSIGAPGVTAQVLIAKTKQEMDAVGFDHSTKTCGMTIISPNLAMLHVSFDSPESVKDLREKFFKHKKILDGAATPIWCNVISSRKERQPARLLNRAFEWLTLEEEDQDEPVKFEKKNREKQVWIEGTRTSVFYIMGGQPRITRWMKTRYGEDQANSALTYITN